MNFFLAKAHNSKNLENNSEKKQKEKTSENKEKSKQK